MAGLPIDDAMVALVYSGDIDPETTQSFMGRTALLQLLRKHGYDGKGGVRDLAAAIDTWQIALGPHTRVSTVDLHQAVEDGRIMPTVRIFRSDWDTMMATPDLTERRRLAQAMRDVLTGPFRYYERRLASLDKVIDEIDAAQAVTMAVGPSSRPLLPVAD